ncbi:unnamed protein product [Sphagnum balticum]
MVAIARIANLSQLEERRMKAQRELQAMLDEYGAVLCRRKKHLIYKFPDGRILTVSATGSDSQRGMRNALADLKRMVKQ